MTKRENFYDFIIAGAGCSGLSLLWHLIHSSLKNKKILVIDSRLSNPEDKIWSYWGQDEHPFQHLNIKNWNWLKVSALGEPFLKELHQYRYHSIRSRDYHDFILRDIESNKNVTLLEAEIFDIMNDDSTGIIKSSKGTFQSPYIFQSIRMPEESKNKAHFSVRQHFVGWEIETKYPVFDPFTVTLMDFRPIYSDAVCFFYILPFTNKKALVEYTLFSTKLLSYNKYTDALQKYIRYDLNLQQTDYRIVREEKGNIPMEDRYYPWQTGKYIYNLGSVGGLTKPTTGYTFKQIQKFVPKLVRLLEENDLKIISGITNQSPKQYLLFDRLFLNILQHEPDIAVRVFHDLFKNNPFDRVLAFLCDETNWRENLQIMWSVPMLPFLKSLWETKSILLK